MVNEAIMRHARNVERAVKRSEDPEYDLRVHVYEEIGRALEDLECGNSNAAMHRLTWAVRQAKFKLSSGGLFPVKAITIVEYIVLGNDEAARKMYAHLNPNTTQERSTHT